ncbi:Putatively involved in type II secretion system [Elusimicrobium minutum Pei191]|uniref:Putatively involved in type II secretion system n=1 Tax=Elusimicrobium minutum (strain Pei191) TaxID=445932 RepID=B2KDU8_ELUMP|nr:tetratricopeptide repeat protein [Elusimicrobium minutum]ACC98694.1 Putatively involved in type II secretion system [Elusimicrobium minutum Pei191]
MKKLFILAVLCLSVFTIGCGSNNANFKKALYYTDIGRYNDALNLYGKIIKSDPNNYAAYSNRAMVHEKIAAAISFKDLKLRQQHLDYAEKDYLKAVKLNPNDAKILNNLGAFYIDRGQYYNAIIYLNEALRARPNYYNALVNRGIAFYNAGEGIKAYNDFHKAININKDGWLAYYNRGLFYYDIGDYLNAALDQTRVINLKPSYGKAYLERGRALKLNNMYADALDDFKMAVELAPNNAVARYYLAEMFFKNHDLGGALSELLISKQLDPRFVPTYELMGDILALEDNVSAAANYIIAKKLDPANARKYDVKIRRLLSDQGVRRTVESRFY